MTPEQLHHHILHLQLLQQKNQPAGNQQTGGEQSSLLQVPTGVSITDSQRSEFEEFFVPNPNVVSNVNPNVVSNATPNGTPNVDNDPKIPKGRGRPRKTSEAPTPTPQKKKQKWQLSSPLSLSLLRPWLSMSRTH